MSLLDAAYRRLFSHRVLVQDLLGSVCALPLLERLDLSRALPLSPVYVGPALQRRQGDLAWQVPPHRQDDPVLLVGIEHQSRPERYMALRIGTYRHLQLEAFVQQHPSSRTLPVPLMLVLYSGKQAWTASIYSQDLFSAQAPPWPVDHIPRQAYWLIDLKKQSLNQSLPSHSVFGLICRIQHNHGLAHLSELMQTVLNTCPDGALMQDLAAWVNQAILPRCLPNLDLPQHLHLKDIRAMLEDNSDSWLHQWEAQGIEKGRQEGLQSTLLSLIQHKFGRVLDMYWHCVAQGSPQQLAVWSVRVLDADTVDEVFQTPPRTSA
ncbi:MAG TPA: Rpn family recombination-promoting nuclease/putative transposase [Alcaligenes sp.]|nr:Rpn family recombination-promoting nuclease/putative transposase [Alcaligenes sp.]HRL26592.1 Rpn family recombination-promoting nuclease/putative transposase [Alcaligenes sp.]